MVQQAIDQTTERQRLVDLAERFMLTFNRNDLDGMMAFFAEDAVYDEFNGRQNRGLDAIRHAFEPQFSGAFGTMEFLDDDMFVDAATGKVMVSWRCTLEVKGEPTAWCGLDLLHFQDGKLVLKNTYAKTKVPLFQD